MEVLVQTERRYRLDTRPIDPVLAASLVLPVVAIALLRHPLAYTSLLAPVIVAIWRILLPVARRQAAMREVDVDYVFMLAHMYAVSTGRPDRRKLFELNTILGGYGEYQAILRRIAVLAVEWSYGFVRATRLIANRVRNDVFRVFLIRMSEVFRTGDDITRFLRVELGTAVRQFMSSYARVIDFMRIFLGLYTTLMSASAFIMLTFTVLAVFIGGDSQMFIVSMFALLATLILLALITKMVIVSDPIVYRDNGISNPRLEKLKKSTRLGLGFSIASAAIVYFIARDPSFTLLAATMPMILPGLQAVRIERIVRRVNMFYQVFIRSFGLTFSTVPNYSIALSSILAADYGELTPLIQRLHARISNGVDPHIAFRYFTAESMSMDIMRGTNIVVDTVDNSGDTAETGLMLSDLLIRLSNIRVDRERLARTFEAVTYLMQGLVAAILSAVINILSIFSQYYRQLAVVAETAPEALQYLPFAITIPDIDKVMGVMTLFLSVLVVVNAIVIAHVRGSLRETAFLHMAILALVTVGGMKAIEIISRTFVLPIAFPELGGAP